MLKTIAIIVALCVASVAPAFAADGPHLDATVGYTTTATGTANQSNVLSGNAHFSEKFTKHFSIFADASANGVNRSVSVTLPAVRFNAAAADVGAQLNFSPLTYVTATYGTAVNDTVLWKSEALTNRFAQVSVTTRLF